MILLGAITILTLTAARSTLLELNMAGNEQQRIIAFEKAEAGLDVLYENRAAVIDFNSDVGHADCTGSVTVGEGGCSDQVLTLPSNGFHTTHSKAWSKRVGEAALVCPPAFLEISCTDTKAAFFELRSQYDARADGGANVALTQGLISILPDQE